MALDEASSPPSAPIAKRDSTASAPRLNAEGSPFGWTQCLEAGPPPQTSHQCLQQRPATAPVPARRHQPSPLTKSLVRPGSAPSLAAEAGRKRAAQRLRSPSKVQRKAPPMGKWMPRHHLVDATNDLKPPGLRDYFSVPSSLPEVKEHLRSRPGMKAVLNRLEKYEELQKGQPGHPLTSTVLSTDADATMSPQRHQPGGDMLGSSGQMHLWNSRFVVGIRQNNHIMHPAHRDYFAKASIFDHSASQIWRRSHHIEESTGAWAPEQVLKLPVYVPMGANRSLMGKSGASQAFA